MNGISKDSTIRTNQAAKEAYFTTYSNDVKLRIWHYKNIIKRRIKYEN